MSDRMAVMNQGRLEQVGTPEEIYLRPRTRFVAEFLGAMNWIDGVGVRPEDTRLARVATAGMRSRRARVESTVFLGNRVHVEVRLETGERAVSEVPRPGDPFLPGDPVHVCWLPSDELKSAPDTA